MFACGGVDYFEFGFAHSLRRLLGGCRFRDLGDRMEVALHAGLCGFRAGTFKWVPKRVL